MTRRVNFVRSKDAQKQLARKSLVHTIHSFKCLLSVKIDYSRRKRFDCDQFQKKNIKAILKGILKF